MTIVENHLLTVTGGIDTHADFHVAAVIDQIGPPDEGVQLVHVCDRGADDFEVLKSVIDHHDRDGKDYQKNSLQRCATCLE